MFQKWWRTKTTKKQQKKKKEKRFSFVFEFGSFFRFCYQLSSYAWPWLCPRSDLSVKCLHWNSTPTCFLKSTRMSITYHSLRMVIGELSWRRTWRRIWCIIPELVRLKQIFSLGVRIAVLLTRECLIKLWVAVGDQVILCDAGLKAENLMWTWNPVTSRSSQLAVRFSEQIICADKYLNIFSRQMGAIVYIARCFLHASRTWC